MSFRRRKGFQEDKNRKYFGEHKCEKLLENNVDSVEQIEKTGWKAHTHALVFIFIMFQKIQCMEFAQSPYLNLNLLGKITEIFKINK